MSEEKNMKHEYIIGEGGWGNTIEWLSTEEFSEWDGDDNVLFTVYGFKSRIPSVADTITGEFKESFITFEFVEVEKAYDPNDMFFGKVKPISQKMKE